MNKLFINNYKKAYKALSVILPSIGSFILLIVSILQNQDVLNLIPEQYLPIVTSIIVPLLAFLGRIIVQKNLKLGE